MKVPLSKPYVTEETKEAVIRVLESGNFILGDECRKFEGELADYFGVKQVILVASGTAALYLSLKELGVGRGDEVIVPSHTAFPTVEAIMHPNVNAVPVFIDINPHTLTLDSSQLESMITDKTKVVLPVHLYGAPADLDEVMRIARERNLLVLEDACQAHGAVYKGRKVGSFGDAAALSFYPSKNLGLYGDGGAILTNSEDLAQRVKKLRNHGRSGRYVHEYVGDNLRFDEINAAVGRIQLRNLDGFVEKRRKIAERYILGLDDKLEKQAQISETLHAFHLFVIMANHRDYLRDKLLGSGVSTEVHYPIPAHRQRGTINYFEKIQRPSTSFLPRTDCAVDRILSLPIYPNMTSEEVDYVIKKVNENIV